MERLINATRNSARAFGVLISGQPAFRQEVIALVLSLPVAWVIAPTWRGFALLAGSIVFVLLVEALNTGIEASCNALTREFNVDIKVAKDCGSLAVAFSLLLAGVVWALALWEWLAGAPV